MQSSLRTRKSQAPPRKAQRSGTKLGKPAVPRDRKSRVDDKIKKRMSMRYADISAPRLAEDGSGVPAVPSMPVGAYGAGMGGAGSRGGYDYGYGDDEGFRDVRGRVDVRESDMRAFERDGFDPDACE